LKITDILRTAKDREIRAVADLIGKKKAVKKAIR
jgi:hypothetical protein